jgi:hypothetical protein
MKTIATAHARRRTIAALASIAFLVLAVCVVYARRSDTYHGPEVAVGINGESTDGRHAGEIELAAAPAATSASVADDTLTVTGSDASERIALRLAPGVPTTLQVDLGDDGSADQQFDRGTFRRVVVLAGAGSDRIRVDDANGAFIDDFVTLDGGGGDDVIDGGLGADSLLGAPATTGSTAVTATTPSTWVAAGTPSSGTPATTTTRSKARPAATPSTSGVRTSPRSSS